MREPKTPLVLFSVRQADLTDTENNQNHEATHRVLQSLGYKFSPAVGVTKRWGKERSFLVVLPSISDPEYDARLGTLHRIASDYNQESYIYVHADRFAELVELDPSIDAKPLPLGYLQKVTKALAESIGDYTTIGEDAYYACLTDSPNIGTVSV